ncbi:MAG: methylmalonyl-CoA epimerase [Anaerolineae bacterium]|nr:methylmalonyl-CoA epimerase [Anaerolineae bacterium]
MRPSIHHIAIAVRDMDAALALYGEALGLEVSARREVPEEGVEIAFLPAGDGEIELIRPLDTANSVARFLEKRGEGLHHICLKVANLEEALERLRRAGVRTIGEPRTSAAGTRYIFLHPLSTRGVLIELYEER